jgi:amino acid adenylation domain-containing protein
MDISLTLEGAEPVAAPAPNRVLLTPVPDPRAGGREVPATLHGLFAARAALAPRAVALVAAGEEIPYGELERRANRLAHHLRALGVGPEGVVGVCLEWGPEMVAAQLGVLAAGGAYLPLDPAHPAERLARMAADAGAGVVVTRTGLAAHAPRAERTVLVDADAARIAARPDTAPEGGAGPDNLAYVIYTSGSTGRPKGVAVEHRAAAEHFRVFARCLELGPGDRMLQFASPGFDVALEQVFSPLLSGAATVLRGPEPWPPAEWPARARALGVTVANLAPAYWQEVAEAAAGSEYPELRLMLVGADVMTTQAVRRWRGAVATPARLLNGYGPTEAVICATVFDVPAGFGAAGDGPTAPIGHSLPGRAAYVLDPCMGPVPAGVAGELYLGGPLLARGYLGRPERTAGAFVPDPFGGVPGGRLYRTGDRVRRRADGALEFLGRVDHQVKVRGVRVEPGEVEAALRAHPAVREALVVLRAHRGEGLLVGYVLPARGESAPGQGELRAWLAARLPEPMVPSALVVLAAFPLTPNGKVDRAALPAPDFAAAGTAAARTPTEEVLAGLFAEVLGLERAGPDDDFFEAGGHSLRATRLVTRVRDVLGAELPLPAVFEAPTVAALARRVDAVLREGAGTRAPDLLPVPRDPARPLPLSFAQQRLWFLHRLDPAGLGYNVPFPLRLRGAVDPPALRRALDELVRRHESLRTVFAAVDGRAAQVVLPPVPAALPQLDLRGLPGAARERELRRLCEDTERPFDLERGPVLRAVLVRLDADDAALLLSMHHVASDGWSVGVLFRELSALYAAFRAGESSPLAPLPVQYADFAVWQREWLTGAVLERLLAWWRARLAGAPSQLELPADRPRPAVLTGRGGLHSFRVAPAVVRALRALARREGATLYMVARAAFDVLLSRRAGQEDLVVGSPIANRTRAETEGLIGFFVNTLALRSDLSGDPEFGGLLRRVRAATLNAYAHQDLPFERLVEEIAPERGPGHTPLFQVMFVLQNASAELMDAAGTGLAPLHPESRLAQFQGIRAALFDLEAELTESGEEVIGSFRFRTDLFDAATVERMASHYLALLEEVAAEPGRRLSLLPALGPGERRMLAAFGAGPARRADRAPVHLRIAERAALSPRAPAVLADGGWLTYAELDERAERLADRLRGAGIERGTRVGVCVDRGPGVLVAMLAVWKAGGVYLPLDPSHPAERLAFLLADSGAELVVSDGEAAGALPAFGGRIVPCDTPHPPAPSPTRGEGENGDDTSAVEGREALPQNWGSVAALRPPGGGPSGRQRETRVRDFGPEGRDPAGHLSSEVLPRGLDSVSERSLLAYGAEARPRRQPGARPDPPSFPDDVAYLIYTSGSTGQPKAVMVTHGQLAHTLDGAVAALGFTADDEAAALASVAFDIALLELLCPLLAGGRVHVVPRDTVRDVDALVDAAAGATVLHAVPALMRQVVERARGGAGLPRLRTLLVGGDAVPPDLLEEMRAAFPGARTHVLYGPTEGTIICATYPVPAAGPVEGHPLGRPLPGVELRVLDAGGEDAPLGVPGELCIAGGGVALGYLGRPELTAARFAPAGGGRAYRTGDRARWRADGVLEFLGRTDEQVKVRGFRVEPGEVEAALRAEAGVREAVVVAREAAPGDRRLVAYVVPAADAADADGDAAAEQVAGWEAVFEATYGEAGSAPDPTLDLTGWNSSYTGRPLPEPEMREWVERTVERVLALRPRRVLEIGCGTGLLLFRVAPHTLHYHGTDFSRAALELVARHLAELPQVRLSARPADRLEGLEAEDFDTVVVNSVAQYFPGADYLLRVLEGAVSVVRPGGRVFVGDVRGLPLLGAFHASVELFRAPDDLPAARLRERVRRGMAEEQELLLDPAFFEALRGRIPRLRRVEVQAKRGGHDNEVSRFRYDVVLHLDAAAAPVAAAAREWGGEDADALRRLLAEAADRPLALLGVPDARTREHVRALELLVRAGGSATVRELREMLSAEGGRGIDPEALFALAEETGRAVEVRPGAAGELDVLFHAPGRTDAALPARTAEVLPPEAYAGDPRWGRRMRALVPALRAGLRERLPEYMVPGAFVVLERLPLTANGKVDRAALPDADESGGARGHVPPRTPLEERLAAIWAEVLGVERVGADDGFFDLGGHSLMATRVVARVREELRVELPLRALFEAPTVARLAPRVEALRGTGEGAQAPPLVPVPRDRPVPLSFAQQRLWFVEQMEAGSALYNVPFPLRLRGPLDPGALRRSLAELVRRHEPLRTVVGEVDGEAVQTIRPARGVPLPVLDLSGLPPAAREAEAARLVDEDALRPFDLARGPLLRAAFARLAPDDALLLLSLHHVVSDGWSRGVFTRELSALYGAAAAGRPSPLPPLPVQYADFAVWQRAWLAAGTLERQLAWWRERLDGAPPLLELPTDRPRSPVRGARGGTRRAELSAAASRALRELARREGATPFMAFLAAWALLLARWSGQDDVVVGTPTAGRTHEALEGMIGMFVNTLPLRVDLSGDPPFRELLARARETALGGFAHQDVPFERLVEALGVERSLTHAPLVQAMLSLPNVEVEALRLGTVEAELVQPRVLTARHDLILALEDETERVAAAVTYRADLFDDATAERMLDQLGVLLDGIAADPGRRISALPLLTAAERERVLVEWNATDAPFPDGVCLHELVEEQARRAPGAPALVHGARTLTYAELDRAAGRLARGLRARGVAPETRVALLLAPSPAMIVALLAVLKAGGAYVPLDTASPSERLRWMLADSGARLVLTQAELADRLPRDTVEVVVLEEEIDAPDVAGALSHSRTFALSHSPSPENLAYVIYTSGSTGHPKGVLVAHRGVCNSTAAFVRAYGIGAGSRVLLFAPLHFDAAVLDVFTALCSGATLVVAPREALMPGEGLVALLARERVTHLKITPAALAVTPPAALPELEAVIVGGESCGAELVARWAPGRRFFNGYGATEHSVRCTAMLCTDATRPPPLGRPVANARLYVLDARLEPVPVGVPGEVYMAGLQVARGYLGRAELTAERFVPDPFRGVPGARMYRSGDRGRWLPDGVLEFVGRTDFQVKVRGFRIEPGEVEAALLEHPALGEAVVVARGAAAEERHLVAYVAPRRGATAPAAAELREHLRARLPEYMVPSAVVALEALPLTPAGKTDRRALPVPEVGPGESFVVPRTPAEELLAAIWADTLGVESVGAHDDFFARGGHSLAATVIVARARRAFGVELPLRAVFEAPTVSGLAERVQGLLASGEGEQVPPPARIRRTGPVPLSFAQQRLWFIEQLDPGTTGHNLSYPQRLRGPLDPAALRRALTEAARRHEALRTRFPRVDGEPVQDVAAPAPVPLPCVDLARLPAEARERVAARLAPEETRRSFDLARGPLLRARLLRLGEDDHALLLTAHHLVFDGWSVGVLHGELAALYGAYAAGREPALPDLPVQYADYTLWQRGVLAGEALEARLGWWRDRLAGAPQFLELPTDHRRPAVADTRGRRVDFVVPPEAASALRALARSEGATLFMALLAVWQTLLARYAGEDDVVVGAPIAGRTRAELAELVGFFVNTLALRGDLSGDPPFRELLGRVRETTLGAYARQDVPFERLVEALGVERSLAHTPLFQVMFTLQNAERSRLRLPGVRAEEMEYGTESARFDAALTLVEAPDRLWGRLVLRADLWEEASGRRMAAHLLSLLDAVAADPARPLSGLPLLGAAERREVLERWNGAPDVPRSHPVHELLADLAARAPDAAAVQSAGAALTRAELDREAAGIARMLRARGVGPEVRVGVCLERSARLVAAVLGVWKAGGAFVPLDPEHPAGRLAHALADSGIRVLLTQESLLGRLPELACEVVCLDVKDGNDRAADGNALPHSRTFALSHSQSLLAYVIYTSGSTGTPKGVLVQHGSLAGTLLAAAGEFGCGEGEVSVALASHAFDIWLFETFAPLLAGGAVRVVPRETVLDVDRLVGELAEADALHAVPALMREVVRGVRGGPGTLPRVRRVYVGGDAVPPELVEEMRTVFPAAELRVLYGPTEAAILCASSAAAAPLPGQMLGLPLPGAALYVCDAAGEPVPLGVPGEVRVGGGGVARGFGGRPDATAAAFVPDPFSGVAGARLYRTGDRARRLPDGRLEFLGRGDRQVKVRGHRIEPGEVESALCGHPAVRDALVTVRDDAAGERRLVAYLVPAEGGVDGDALRARLRRTLPEYMLPSAFVPLAAFPLTPTGKVDRRALPAPEAAARAAHTAPRGATQEAVARIWAEVLGVERVGADEDFFALGGHSLLATRVVSRIRRAWGVELPLRALFEAPTVAGVAARVDALEPADDGDAAPPLVPVRRDGPLPLSFAQQRLWFLDRMDPGAATYNMAFPLRLRGPLHAGALRRALGEVVRRHEGLRARFPEREGAPVLEVDPAAAPAFPVVDLLRLAEADRGRELARLADAHASAPFRLAAGPLLRAALVRLGDGDHALLLAVHHAVSDGWSTGILFRELSALYDAYAAGRPSPLPELPVQYADFAAWQRAWLAGPRLERQLRWWTERLAGAPPLLELPTDRPRSSLRAPRSGREPVRVPPGVAAALRALAAREGATPFMVLLAAWQALLGRRAAQEDVVVGTPVAGRTRAETEGLIGLFVNTLALRADLSGDPAFVRLLARVRETALGAFAHQELPFERLVDAVAAGRSLTHAPVVQASFTLQNLEAGELRLPGVDAEPAGGARGPAKFDVALVLADGDDGSLRGEVDYEPALFDPSTVRRLAWHLEAALERVAADPAARLAALFAVPADELRQVVAAWNATAAPSSPRPVHEMIVERAAAVPGAPAVLCGGRTLTFGELEARSARLARLLVRRGVGPETRVALCLERTPDLLVAVLAVLRAGGAYVPLDPSYPAERLALVLEDAAAPLVLAHSATRAALPPHGAETLSLDETADPGAAPGRAADGSLSHSRTFALSHSPSHSPSSLAYVVHTSGSTGRPRGVGVQHASLANLAFAARREFGFGAGDVVACLASCAFDIWVFETLVPLAWGAAVRLVPRERVAAADSLLDEIADATVLHAVPALMRQVAAAARARGGAAGVRRAFVGGDAVPPDLVEEMRAAFPRAELHVLYGPTEATVLAASRHAGAEPLRGREIGRPLPNVRALVLDGTGEPAPAGTPGELYLGGAGVARGYLGLPATTAERWLPDPFSGEAGARLYRTGDRARWRTDGTLEFLGRTDRQVKVRGFRIEPAEVEAVLRAQPGVRDAVVLAREDAPGDARLVAYVVPEPGAGPAARELRDALHAVLPGHMVPGAVVALDALPLTPSGKVDAAALPPPGVPEGEYAAPRTAVEEVLARDWAAVLGVERVGIHDDFFALGGHSLLAAQLVARLRLLRVEVPVRLVFEAPTVERMAEHVVRAGARPGAVEAVAAVLLRVQGMSAGEKQAALRGRQDGRVPGPARAIGADE